MFCDLFIDMSEGRKSRIPVLWGNHVRPTQANCFLIHILLSFGEFNNEMKILHNGNIKEVYIQAGLFWPKNGLNSIKIDETIHQKTIGIYTRMVSTIQSFCCWGLQCSY